MPGFFSTKASVENLDLLQQGKGEICIALGDSVKLAAEGNADAGFPAPLDKRVEFQRCIDGAPGRCTEVGAAPGQPLTLRPGDQPGAAADTGWRKRRPSGAAP